jgi:hypothetical protein
MSKKATPIVLSGDERSDLPGASFTNVDPLRQAIDRFIATYNPKAAPFEWRKAIVRQTALKPSYTNLLN